MRVTSEFFVSSLIRKIFGDGGFAVASQKGAPEAGAVQIIVDRLDGTYDFYAPAPQAMFSDQAQGRLFEKLLETVDRSEIDQRLDREKRMDPDFWVVEIEAADGAIDLPLVEEEKDTSEADKLFRF